MPYHQNAVGERIYVFSENHGAKSTNCDHCVISAHGRQTIMNSTFTNNAVNLHYYVPHGYSLKDPGLRAIMQQSKRPCQIIQAGRSPDYVLSKFQGRHGNNAETYTSIGNDINTAAVMLTNIQNSINHLNGFQRPDTKDIDQYRTMAEKTLSRRSRKMDVVTIRNRRLRFDLNLSDVIQILHQHGYNYTNIHCSFCRSPTLPFNDRGSANAQNNP
jgi:hypothetical protein